MTYFYVTMDININLTNSINLSMFSVHMGINACCDFIHAGTTECILRQLYISNEL